MNCGDLVWAQPAGTRVWKWPHEYCRMKCFCKLLLSFLNKGGSHINTITVIDSNATENNQSLTWLHESLWIKSNISNITSMIIISFTHFSCQSLDHWWKTKFFFRQYKDGSCDITGTDRVFPHEGNSVLTRVRVRHWAHKQTQLRDLFIFSQLHPLVAIKNNITSSIKLCFFSCHFTFVCFLIFISIVSYSSLVVTSCMQCNVMWQFPNIWVKKNISLQPGVPDCGLTHNHAA